MTTNSYVSSSDVLKFSCASHRAIAPARDALPVTPNDTNDLPVYGKLAVFNAGTAAEVIRAVTVECQDDSVHVDLKVPVGLTVIDWLIIRAVRATGTGADITAWVLT
jgi:hypothetical protein